MRIDDDVASNAMAKLLDSSEASTFALRLPRRTFIKQLASFGDRESKVESINVFKPKTHFQIRNNYLAKLMYH